MVFEMVTLEGDGAGEKQGGVCKHACEFVCGLLFKEEFVGTFVDHYKEGVACKSAEKIGDKDREPPGLAGHEKGDSYLKTDQADDSKNGEGVFANEFADVGEFF